MQKKHIIAGLSVAVALTVGPAVVAAAAPMEVLGHGSTAGGVVIGRAGSGSSADREARAGSGDGSFWQWGVGKDDTYSNYFREKSCHGSAAVGKKTKRVTNVRGGIYSKALTPKASGNKAYYHTC